LTWRSGTRRETAATDAESPYRKSLISHGRQSDAFAMVVLSSELSSGLHACCSFQVPGCHGRRVQWQKRELSMDTYLGTQVSIDSITRSSPLPCPDRQRAAGTPPRSAAVPKLEGAQGSAGFPRGCAASPSDRPNACRHPKRALQPIAGHAENTNAKNEQTAIPPTVKHALGAAGPASMAGFSTRY
jgi:hypothetical protein